MPTYRNYLKNSVANKVFDSLNITFLALFSFLMIYPFINQLVLSFNDGNDALKGGLYFFPRKFSWDSYRFLLKNASIWKSFLLSFLRVLVGTVTCLLGTGLLAYITTIQFFSGRKLLRVLFLITLYFSGGLIPSYLLMVRLGLINTFEVYWVPGIFNAYYMLLMASFFAQSVPDSVTESARIDGAGELRIYFQIVLPVSLPVFAAIAIYSGVGHWNSWFDVMIYNAGTRQFDTVQIVLQRMLNEAQGMTSLQDAQALLEMYRDLTITTVRAAATTIVVLPIVFIYPFFQKYFIGGITVGAVKG